MTKIHAYAPALRSGLEVVKADCILSARSGTSTSGLLRASPRAFQVGLVDPEALVDSIRT